MATKSGQPEAEKAETVEELLDTLDAALDRVKVLYEQYFLGIQRQPPTYLHTDLERRFRDLAQLQVRNTALRYRFATLQQKFSSYNAYWRRTLRQIESGTYTRNLSKIGRQAARTGAAIPEEILAAMPKRMREQVKRDREAVLALAELRSRHAGDPEFLTLAEEDEGFDVDIDDLAPAGFVQESTELRRSVMSAGGAHQIDASDADFDLDAFFASITSEGEPSSPASPGQTSGAAAIVPPSTPIEAPVIRWRTPASQPEPRSPLEARLGARPISHPRPDSGSGIEPPGIERSIGRRPSTDRPFTERPGTERPPTPRLSSPGPGIEPPSTEVPVAGQPVAGQPIIEPPSTGSQFARLPGRGLGAGRPSAELPKGRSASSGDEPPPVEPPSTGQPGSGAVSDRPLGNDDAPTLDEPPSTGWPSAGRPSGERPSIGQLSGGRLNTGSPTARLPGLGLGQPDTGPPTARLPGPGLGQPDTGPPTARLPGVGLGQPDTGPPTARLSGLGLGQPNTGAPTARLSNPVTGQLIDGQPIEGHPIEGQLIDGQLIDGHPSDGTPISELPVTGSSSTSQPNTRHPNTRQPFFSQPLAGPSNTGAPTARLSSSGGGQPSAGPPSPGGGPPSTRLPSASPSGSGAGQAPAETSGTGAGQPSTVAGQPGSGGEQPSAGAGSSPRPQSGMRPTPPGVVIPPVRVPPAHVVPRLSSPLPSQIAPPNPVKPPTLAPSQATRPIPVLPGASAARSPSPVETLAGPFPRIPSPPALPSKVRAGSGAPGAAPSRPASDQAPPGFERAPPGEPAPIPMDKPKR